MYFWVQMKCSSEKWVEKTNGRYRKKWYNIIKTGGLNMAGRIYSNDFKVQAVKRVIEDGISFAQVARELGIVANIL